MNAPIITSAKLIEVADLYPGAPDWKAAMLYAADEIDRLTADRNLLTDEMREALALNNEMERLFDEACDERDRLTADLAARNGGMYRRDYLQAAECVRSKANEADFNSQRALCLELRDLANKLERAAASEAATKEGGGE